MSSREDIREWYNRMDVARDPRTTEPLDDLKDLADAVGYVGFPLREIDRLSTGYSDRFQTDPLPTFGMTPPRPAKAQLIGHAGDVARRIRAMEYVVRDAPRDEIGDDERRAIRQQIGRLAESLLILVTEPSSDAQHKRRRRSPVVYSGAVATLGRLAGEPPEPMTRDDFACIQKRIHASFKGNILIDRGHALRMLEEIRWLKRRLQRAEHALEPLVDAINPDA